MKRKSFYKIIFDQFWSARLSRVGTLFVVFMLMVAMLASFIASNRPYYYVEGNGTMTFPVMEHFGQYLRDLASSDLAKRFPVLKKANVNLWHYPHLIDVKFRERAKDPKVNLIMPPIPYSPTEYDLDSILLPPSSTHWMGTDDQGRDIAARMVHGAQVSLSVGFVAVGIYVMLGIIIGSIAGYFGGKIDLVISRVIEIVMCFPTFFLILTVLAFIGPSLLNIMIVIGLTGWTGIARLVRGEFLKLRDLDFVTGSRALGASNVRIIFRHIFPNSLAPVLVSITFGVASSILIESSLSFLGFGVQPPTPSWGEILSQSREFMDIAWWLMVFPGIAIFLTITAFNLVGEGIRDAIDPRG